MFASIVITNYNYARFLAQAIDSALAQTHPDREVIVVDDGSGDGSRDVMAQYGDAIVPILKANGGQGSAANAGFARARGELVLFLDADDFLLPHALSAGIAAWEEGLAKIQCAMELVDAEGQKLGVRYPHMLHEGDVAPIVRQYLDYASTPTSGNIFSRQALDRIFPLHEESTRVGLDYQVSCLVAFYGRVKCLPDPFTCYRMHMKAGALIANHQYKSPAQHLLRNARVREAVRQELVQRGFVDAEARPALPPYELRSRMVTLVSDPVAYPYRDDTRIRIAIQGTRAAWNWPGYKPISRITLTAWLWIIAIAPGPAARHIIRWGVIPTARPWPIRMLVRLLETRRG